MNLLEFLFEYIEIGHRLTGQQSLTELAGRQVIRSMDRGDVLQEIIVFVDLVALVTGKLYLLIQCEDVCGLLVSDSVPERLYDRIGELDFLPDGPSGS